MSADGRQKLSCFWLPLPFRGAHYMDFIPANQHGIFVMLFKIGPFT
jgi:hypothetical protein